MRVYAPSCMTPRESEDWRRSEEQLVVPEVSDKVLQEYPRLFLAQYREVLERYFSPLTSILPLYARHPYRITVLRIDRRGTFIGYRPDAQESVRVLDIDKLDPPLTDMNLFAIRERLQAGFMTFDLAPRTYDAAEAEIEGTRLALQEALYCLWMAITSDAFNSLCLELVEAEGISTDPQGLASPQEIDAKFDAVREVLLAEAAGFRRTERWGFQFRHHQDNRVSAADLREFENYLEEAGEQMDVVCLVTSGDLTSIGNSIAVHNPRLRVWDRDVLNRLLNKHLGVLSKYFETYPVAVESLTRQLDRPLTSRLKEFEMRLAACPTGHGHFAEYERIGIEIWHHIFQDRLGEPKPQRRTADGTQRRDVLFRNLLASTFFERIFHRFKSEFVIVDFKNYEGPVEADVIRDVAKYANEAIGKLVFVVSRKGAARGVERVQHREFRDRSGVAVLVVDDKQMIEMVERKERGENPDDVLDDLLGEFLSGF